MLMLPPIPPSEAGGRRNRRVGDRRTGGRRATDRAEAVDPAAPAAEAREGRKPVRGRGGGRRASDREQAAPADAAPFGRAPKPHAPLVAQLVATVLDVEQTRARRRGTLDEAVALYEQPPERPKRSRGEA
jgi:hypothetical protein